MAGKNHPETGVPFEKKTIKLGGQETEVVVPRFESEFDAVLPDDLITSTDARQFSECNAQLRESIEKYPELEKRFNAEQLEDIRCGDTPSGYTWHHNYTTCRYEYTQWY